MTSPVTQKMRLEAELIGAPKLADLPARFLELPKLDQNIIRENETLQANRIRIDREVKQSERRVLQVKKQILGVNAQVSALIGELEIIRAETARIEGLSKKNWYRPKFSQQVGENFFRNLVNWAT